MNPTVTPLFTGCATALVTPMDHHAIHKEAYHSLLYAQIDAGIDALVITGTTGESATLTDSEKQYLYTTAVQTAKAKNATIPIIAGTGSNNTARAIELSIMAEEAGVDALLLVTPYYNKASQSGLIAHFTAIAEAVTLPVILYHVPSRTGCNLTPETCAILSQHPRIQGLKDATGNPSFTAHVSALCGNALPLYAGNDDSVLPLLSLGGVGVISVVSNLLPSLMVALCRAWREGDTATSLSLQKSILPLCDALFSEVNPIPIKCAMSLCGMCHDEVRLPLDKAPEHLKRRLQGILPAYGFTLS